MRSQRVKSKSIIPIILITNMNSRLVQKLMQIKKVVLSTVFNIYL